MRKILLAAMLLTLGGLAFMGASPLDLAFRGPVGAGGVDPTPQYTTNTVIFSASGMVDVPAGQGYASAGIDTFAYPSSATAIEQRRIHHLNDIRLGRASASWLGGPYETTAEAMKDTATVIRIGTGTGGRYGCPTFAFAQIDTLAPTGYLHASGTQEYTVSDARWQQDPDAGGSLPTSSYNEMKFATANRRADLVYLPFADHIPANSTIVSAFINVCTSANDYFAYEDSLVVTLMSNAADNQWWPNKGAAPSPDNFVDYAGTSWRRQRTSLWGGSDASPWVPQLGDRKHLYQWGEVSDWTGGRISGAGSDSSTQFIAAGGEVWIAATNCVQAAVNGSTNNGLLMTYHDRAAATATFAYRHWDDGRTASQVDRTPYIVVKYITKQYQEPFGSSDWAMVFGTDDAKYPANDAYADTIESLGGKYTLYMAEVQVASGSGASTAAQLVGFHTRGHEVGSHSRRHLGLGLSYYERKDAPFSTEDWDSLLYDADPEWLYLLADPLVGDLRGDQNFGKSLALPNNVWSPTVINAMQYHGYVTMRARQSQYFDYNKYFDVANFAPARTDSIMSGATRKTERYRRNMIGLPYTVAVSNLFGIKGNAHTTTAELDSVAHNIRKMVFQLRGDGRRTLMLFNHDFKTSPSTTYSDGLDAVEVGTLGRVTNALGGRWMTASEYGRWIQATATPVDSPTRAAVPDSFSYDAADRVWFKPDGIDNRWIRGIK